MDAGPLNQLHDPGDKNQLAVAHSVDLHFTAADIVVHEYGAVRVNRLRGLKVFAQIFLLGDDLHGAAAQNEAGTDKNRIADLLRSFQTFGRGSDGEPFRLRYAQRFQQLLKLVAVFCSVNSVAVRADDPYAAGAQRICQIDRGLASERRDDALRLFHLDHVHDVLHAQGLEVQLIRASIVRGNGFRIVVDDDRFVTGLLDRLHGVHS